METNPKEFAALVPETQERQNTEDEIAANKATYLAWKADLERTGKTPSDAVAQCRDRGMDGYADWLESLISQMEGSD